MLPKEIIDKVLLYSDVRIAIQLGNEHVKRKLLCRLSLRRLWKSKDPAAIAWLKKYDVGGEFATMCLNFMHPARELLMFPDGIRPPVPVYRMTAEEEAAERVREAQDAADDRVRASVARIRKRARRDVKVNAVMAYKQRVQLLPLPIAQLSHPRPLTHMDYFEAPASILPTSKTKIFLAGGISGCPDWQQHAFTELQDFPVCIYNPRRQDFPQDVTNDDHARAQIEWEFNALALSDIIVFWFPKESVCPIALYELGRWNHLSVNKKIVIGAHPDYIRRQDVVIQTELATGATIFDSLDQMLHYVKSLI